MSGAVKVVTRITKGEQIDGTCTLEGEYYVYHSGAKVKDTEKYCFKVGEEWIPAVFMGPWFPEAKKNAAILNAADVVTNSTGDGWDFNTGPRDMQ
jgi:hypothetical protein